MIYDYDYSKWNCLIEDTDRQDCQISLGMKFFELYKPVINPKQNELVLLDYIKLHNYQKYFEIALIIQTLLVVVLIFMVYIHFTKEYNF